MTGETMHGILLTSCYTTCQKMHLRRLYPLICNFYLQLSVDTDRRKVSYPARWLLLDTHLGDARRMFFSSASTLCSSFNLSTGYLQLSIFLHSSPPLFL